MPRNNTNAMEALKRKYNLIKSEIGDIEQSAASVPDAQRPAHHNDVMTLMERATVVINDILKDTPDDEQDDITQDYLALKRTGRQLASFFTSPPVGLPSASPISSGSSSASCGSSSLSLKLPPIELPTFASDKAQWPIFAANFKNLLARDPNLSEEDKLHYLKSAMRDQAKQVIASVVPGPNSFDEAWKLLKQQYQHHRQTVSSIVRKITSYAPPKDSKAMQRFIIDMRSQFSTLSVLGITSEDGAYFWNTIILDKMDANTRHAFEGTLKDDKIIPTVQSLLDFLHNRIQEELPVYTYNTNKLHEQGTASSQSPIKSSTSSTYYKKHVSAKCPECSSNMHTIMKCPIFFKASVDDKYTILKKHKLCTNCLQPFHGKASQCERGNCKQCGQKHFSSLHRTKESSNSKTANVNHNLTKEEDVVLLQTAIVYVKTRVGNIPLRAVIDGGSTTTLITESAIKALQLSTRPSDKSIIGIGSVSHDMHLAADLVLTSQKGDFSMKVTAHAVENITTDLPTSYSAKTWPHIQGLDLADIGFYRPSRVDLLLGANVMNSFMCAEIRDGDNGPRAQLTRFGWVLQGPTNTLDLANPPIGSIQKNSLSNTQVSSQLDTLKNDTLHLNPQAKPFIPAIKVTSVTGGVNDCQSQKACLLGKDKRQPQADTERPELSRFWELYDPPLKRILTIEEQQVEGLFKGTTLIQPNGRYCVQLPLRNNPPDLGESRTYALARFRALERKFTKDPLYYKLYMDTILDYLKTGHLVRAPVSPTEINPRVYLPHHSVFSKHNNKLRIVFDGSLKTSNNKSLNDELLMGPKTQQELFDILLRFRMYQVAITADLKQMFRQIDVFPDCYNLQTILWRDSPDQPIEDYHLTVVTWGTRPASYLATRVLIDIADRATDAFPEAAVKIRQDFYADDLLSGADSISEAKKIRDQVTRLCANSGFTLHKWASSAPSVIADINPGELKQTIISETDLKTLGIKWNNTNDTFSLVLPPRQQRSKVTKRTILSDASSVFDPHGYVSPVLLKCKLLIQRLWQDTLITWDSKLPPKIAADWDEFMLNLQSLQSITIPRKTAYLHAISTTLCGFSDASEKAYSAVVYMRQQLSDGQFKSHLLASKTKVAPTTVTTLPRLELCGALLLARLMSKITSAINIPHEVIAFTDSTVTLHWIRSHPSKWKIFVAHRVQEIQDCIPPQNWYHVRSQENIADIASRGVTPAELISNNVWWFGPNWLRDIDYMNIPDSVLPRCADLPEEKPQKVLTSTCSPLLPVISKISSFTKLIRTMAYVRRFLSPFGQRPKGEITGEEFRLARYAVLRNVQKAYFAAEITAVQKGKPVSCSSFLHKYSPFLCPDGLLRVGGRLRHADLPEETKHPIIVPYKHVIAKTIVRYLHIKNEHAGPQLLTAITLQEYFIPKIRNLTRLITRTCVTCARARGRLATQYMADLPPMRVTRPERAFSACGVDMAGPIQLKTHLSRGTRHYKAYICLFICMSTRAIHLELTSSLSAEAFIGAFHRFCARRSTPSRIHSDRGTNFTKAGKFFKEIQENQTVQQFLARSETIWTFNVSSAASWGGYWEAGVKSTKFHLYNILKTQVLTFEEMTTLLCRVEAILNSRPLSPISTDPTDLQALTPAHFLVFGPLTAPPEEIQDTSEKLLPAQRWLLVQRLSQQFWKRWSMEYLTRLNQRPKWCRKQENIKINDLVLIKEDTLPPLQWKLGRVVSVHPSNDGLVRAATVKCQFSTYQRPINKLCPLPLDGPLSEGAAQKTE